MTNYSAPSCYYCILNSTKYIHIPVSAFNSTKTFDLFVELKNEAGFEALDLNSFGTKIINLTTVGLLELVRVGKGRGKGVDRLYILTIPFETLHRAVMDDPVFSAGVKSIVNRIMEERKKKMLSIQ